MAVPSSPADQKKLKGMIDEIVESMYRIETERESMKEIIDSASEQFEVEKKAIRKIATVVFKSCYADILEEHEEFEQLYETLIEGRTANQNNNG